MPDKTPSLWDSATKRLDEDAARFRAALASRTLTRKEFYTARWELRWFGSDARPFQSWDQATLDQLRCNYA